MKIAYASTRGMTKIFLEKLGVENPLEIKDGTEILDREFVLFTPSTGNGEIPEKVRKFLDSNGDRIRAVVANCSSERHAKTFGFAADFIAREFKVPVLYKYEGEGTENDVRIVKNLLEVW